MQVSDGESQQSRPQHRPLACALIGATGMAARCGDLLIEHGYGLFGVFSDDPALLEWARKQGIDCWSMDAEQMADQLASRPFDLLFSVINARILSSKLLALPRVAAINYHDGPLPAYAGVNAAVWAILNGETEHGVCWNLMTATVDAGDIVKQARFPLHDDETAQSLNLRCTEAGLKLFDQLLVDLNGAGLRPVPQATEGASYFSLAERPFAGGLVRWDQPARSILRLVRALDFGRFDNPLALPKVVVGGRVFTFSGASVAEDEGRAAAVPGTAVFYPDDGSLLARCEDAWLQLRGLVVLSRHAPPSEDTRELLAETFAEAPEGQLDLTRVPFDLDRFDTVYRASAKGESTWVDYLQRVEPLDLPLVPTSASERPLETDLAFADAPEPLSGEGQLPRKRLDHDPAAGRHHPFVVLSLFLARLTGQSSVWIRLKPRRIESLEMRDCFLEEVPFEIDCRPGESLQTNLVRATACLERALRLPPPSADLIRRIPWLADWQASNFCVSVDRVGVSFEADADFPWRLFWQRHAAFEEQLTQASSPRSGGDAMPFSAVELALAGERRAVLGISEATARPFDLSKSYIDHLAERIVDHASRVAVRYLDQELSYAELAGQASAVAERLIALELPENSTIAVAAERHIALVPVLLGIFAAGHAYLPLELERYPAERLETMLDDAGVRTAVAFSGQADTALSAAASLTLLDGRQLVEPPADTLPGPDTAFGLARFRRYQAPENTAYLIFTSGTTGVPKGVMVAQRNLVNHNFAVIELFGLTEGDRVLQLGALGFDLSIEEIFPTLLAGARLVLLPDGVKESAPDFFGLIRDEAISVLDLPTAFWHAMVAMLESESLPQSVRLTIIGGEKASVEHAARWRRHAPEVRLINTYGPTETTIIATATEDLTTIGGPIANTFAYVLDAEGKLCPPGVIGDLLIGGEAVAKGYLNREDLTTAAFVPDPFAALVDAAGTRSGQAPKHPAGAASLPGRMYKTGDKASFTDSGELLFFGRADRQIKINGFRIETAEIEQVVLGDPGVTDAAVVVVDLAQAGVGKAPRRELACYFVAHDPAVTAEGIRESLERALPAYMVPRHIMAVDVIPLNRNGKVDKAALPPVIQVLPIRSGSDSLDPDVNSTTELQIAAALRSALHVEQYDPKASFDALGGDSLTAIQFLLDLEKLIGESVSVELLYQAESMEALARKIDEHQLDKPWSALVTLKYGDPDKPPLFLIHTTPGDVLGYINLVRDLDDRTVYGIQARGLDLASQPARSIREMATEYLGIMREKLPEGPYYLSGWCYGGIVGVEMVAQMERIGLRPALFAPIETWGQPKSTLALKMRKLFNLLMWGPRGWYEFLTVKWSVRRGAPTAEDQDLAQLDFISRRFGSSRSADELERMKALYEINTRAADVFVMPRIATRTDLLMIEADSITGQIPDKDYWWRGIAADRKIQRFPGDHATILKEPSVRRVARVLAALMQDVDRTVRNGAG